MIGGVTRQGGLPGLPGRVTLSAGVAFYHVNDSRWGSPPSRGRVPVRVNCLWRRLCIILSDSKKPQHWNVAARADNERKSTLTAKMHRSPAIFSVYMPSDHATTSSSVTMGRRHRQKYKRCKQFRINWNGLIVLFKKVRTFQKWWS